MLREHDVQVLTVGQYLRPTEQHLPVVRYWHPDEFKALEQAAYALGFDHIAAGPLVRSSYHADTHIEQDRPGVGPAGRHGLARGRAERAIHLSWPWPPLAGGFAPHIAEGQAGYQGADTFARLPVLAHSIGPPHAPHARRAAQRGRPRPPRPRRRTARALHARPRAGPPTAPTCRPGRGARQRPPRAARAAGARRLPRARRAAATWKARNMAALRVHAIDDDPGPPVAAHRGRALRRLRLPRRGVGRGHRDRLRDRAGRGRRLAELARAPRATSSAREFRATGVGAAGAPLYWSQTFGVRGRRGQLRRPRPRRWPPDAGLGVRRRRTEHRRRAVAVARARRASSVELRAARPSRGLPRARRARSDACASPSCAAGAPSRARATRLAADAVARGAAPDAPARPGRYALVGRAGSAAGTRERRSEPRGARGRTAARVASARARVPAQGQHPDRQLPDRHGRADRRSTSSSTSSGSRNRRIASTAARHNSERCPVRRDPLRAHAPGQHCALVQQGAAVALRQGTAGMAGIPEPPGRPPSSRSHVHARRPAAPRRQHALPVDLRQQRRGLHGAGALRRLLPARRGRGAGAAGRSSTPARRCRRSARPGRSPASWAATSLLYPRARVLTLIFIIFFFTIIELPALVVLGIWFAQQVSSAYVDLTDPTGGGGGVAYFAHIGGFAFGLLAIRLFAKRLKRAYASRSTPSTDARAHPRGRRCSSVGALLVSRCTRRSRAGSTSSRCFRCSCSPCSGSASSAPCGILRTDEARRSPDRYARARRLRRRRALGSAHDDASGASAQVVAAPLQVANGPAQAADPGARPLPLSSARRADPVQRCASSSRRAAALLFDLDTGEVLWRRLPDRVLPIASLTKMMTALIVVDRARPDAQGPRHQGGAGLQGLGASACCPGASGSSSRRCSTGCCCRRATTPPSRWPSASSGTVAGFVRADERARAAARAGAARASPRPTASRTRATTRAPTDLAVLARAVLDQPRLARIVRRRRAVAALPDQGRAAVPVQQQPAAAHRATRARSAIKTGYTDAAGRCLVAAARRGGRRLGVVLLHSPDPGKQARSSSTAASRHGPSPGRSPTSTARSRACQPTRPLSPASPIHASRSGTVSGRSKPGSSGVTTSAGSSGTTTSASTKRPPGASAAATRTNRSAFSGPRDGGRRGRRRRGRRDPRAAPRAGPAGAGRHPAGRPRRACARSSRRRSAAPCGGARARAWR